MKLFLGVSPSQGARPPPHAIKQWAEGEEKVGFYFSGVKSLSFGGAFERGESPMSGGNALFRSLGAMTEKSPSLMWEKRERVWHK